MSAATAADVLSALSRKLDVPPEAILAGISTSFGADGSREWTITFRAGPADADGALPSAKALERPGGGDDGLSSMPPLPPPLTSLHLNPPPEIQPPEAEEGTGASTRVAAPSPAGGVRGVPPAGAATTFPISPASRGAQGVLAPSPGARAADAQRIFPLRASVMTYAWGKLGSDSLVARMAARNDGGFNLHKETPYAEMWMGTHPSGPSMVMVETPWRIITPLLDWLRLNPSMAGDVGGQGGAEFAGGLPFLFKVLSVRTALSIQAHPDKRLAEQLHAEKPSYYKDDNHKPEMTLAVTPFEALCSFQKVSMILENIRAYVSSAHFAPSMWHTHTHPNLGYTLYHPILSSDSSKVPTTHYQPIPHSQPIPSSPLFPTRCPELAAVVGEAAVRKLAAAADAAAPFTPAWPAARWGRRQSQGGSLHSQWASVHSGGEAEDTNGGLNGDRAANGGSSFASGRQSGSASGRHSSSGPNGDGAVGVGVGGAAAGAALGGAVGGDTGDTEQMRRPLQFGRSRDKSPKSIDELLAARRAAVSPALRELFTALMTAEQASLASLSRRIASLSRPIASLSRPMLTHTSGPVVPLSIPHISHWSSF